MTIIALIILLLLLKLLGLTFKVFWAILKLTVWAAIIAAVLFYLGALH